MTTPIDYATQQASAFRDELKDLLRIPSVSTDMSYADEVKRAAQWLVSNLEDMGLTAELIETDIHPLVYAEWMGAGADAKTVLIYGHFDVQPAAMEDGWDSDPFEPIERDGKIYCRGASDDKGQLFIHVKAVESYLQSVGELPVNVKFILEGEEESGGESIAAFVREHPEKLQADVCVISDGGMQQIEEPAIVYSVRGIIATELIVTASETDLHSGAYGGTVHNPLQALCEIIAQLHAPDGSVAVPGFYDAVVPLSEEERTQLNRNEWTEEAWLAETGAPKPWGEAAYTLLERRGARPTLEINGLGGGYVGEGFKTVLPAQAIAKISCRLVADQTSDGIFELLKQHIATLTPDTVRSELRKVNSGEAATVPIDHPVMEAAVRAYESGWGATPIFFREGGSLPIVADLIHEVGVPVAMMGFGLNSDGIHGPNEHFSIEMFERGIRTAIHFYQECADLG